VFRLSKFVTLAKWCMVKVFGFFIFILVNNLI
jgi:hypothetical protein